MSKPPANLNGFTRRHSTAHLDLPYEVTAEDKKQLRSLERDWNRKKETAR